MIAYPESIPSAEGFGTPLITLFLLPASITSEEALGSPLLALFILPDSISSLEEFGSPQLNQILHAAGGISSAEAFGQPLITQILFPISISSAEAFGSPQLSLILHLTEGIPSAEEFGTLQVNQILHINGTASAEAFGTLRITCGPVWIRLTGIESLNEFGWAILRWQNIANLIILEMGQPIVNLTEFSEDAIALELNQPARIYFSVGEEELEFDDEYILRMVVNG